MQALEIANGRGVADPLPEVVAYQDHALFGALPHDGGALDQPAWLMDGMRVVGLAVQEQRKREADAQEAAAARAAKAGKR